MGAGQSNGRDAGLQGQGPTKTSYYELLELNKAATEDEIKKAYRRKALELHPDRNYGDVERATALFSEIQSAYQVLSDPQERAWYDSHEDAILHDIDPTVDTANAAAYEQNIGLTSAADITRMFRKFNGNVEYSDAPSGFFGFLRDTFEQLSKEEETAASRDSLALPEYPTFGHKDDDHDTAKVFYGVWTAFSTRKSFAWRDRYRVTDAEDRWMRRQMEKENKQFRAEAKQEFNDAVRSLVAFVKKRDPRYIPNTQSEEERQQTLRETAQAQAARMRAANQAKLDEEVPEWTKTREPDDLDELTEEESEEEHFECVACRKVFKSENQFNAHERSKKHQKAVYALRKRLKKEGIALDLEEDDDFSSGLHSRGANEADADRASTLEEDDSRPAKAHDMDQEPPQLHDDDLGNEIAAMSISEGPGSSEDGRHEQRSHTAVHDDAADGDVAHMTSGENSAGTEPGSDGISRDTHKKMGKAAQKRAKRAAQQEDASLDANSYSCTGCGATFPSKRRLFDHLNDHPSHAALKSTSGSKGKKGIR